MNSEEPVADRRGGEPGENGTAIEQAKFDLGAPLPSFDAGWLPWGYGDNRITSLVRSPDSLYVYWEITDEGIADARRRLGASGAHAGYNLRVYDTTRRQFDGTNANSYFDVRVSRSDREYFFRLDRPTAWFHVDIGLMSPEGYFQPIARSGRADFPRKSPSPNGALEWMTVTTDAAHPTARPYDSRYTGPAWWAGAPAGGAGDGAPPPSAGGSLVTMQTGHATELQAWSRTHSLDVRWEGPWTFDEWHTEWRVHWLGAALRTAWAIGPLRTWSWRIGPFPIDSGDPGRLEIRFAHEGPFLLEELRSGLQLLGPWRIAIKRFAGTGGHRVIGEWRVHVARVSPPHVERWWSSFERRRVGAFRRELLLGGASEARGLLEAGASELWRAGASERAWLGGSEWLALGASEVAWLGASEVAFAGASAWLGGGASGWGFGGASETQWLGASQWAAAGASETQFLGASETQWLGASESAQAGASETLWPGASEWAQGGASEREWLGASEREMQGASERASEERPPGASEQWTPGTPGASDGSSPDEE